MASHANPRCFFSISRCWSTLAVIGITLFSPAQSADGEIQNEALKGFNDMLSSWKHMGSAVYYEFDTAESDTVWSGHVPAEGVTMASAETQFPLASSSKLFTGVAAMYTMQLKPNDWYPDKGLQEFKGWEDFKNFELAGKPEEKANLTIHNLLTHTSGLPFGLRYTKEDIRKLKLFFHPGMGFGYTLGHRVIGWLLRDYWREQPETREFKLETVQDTYKWLLFDRLNLSCQTNFADVFDEVFGPTGEAGDASISSTGEDFMKLAVLALRRGQLPSGERLISEENWNKWAVPNLLPGGKLTEDLVAWQHAPASWADLNVGGAKEKIMRQSGPYGWNYFGATYYDSREIGWCGFFSSCLRVSYPEDLAFVMMQRDVADLKKSKPYVVKHYSEMAKSLQCKQKTCARKERSSIFCEHCAATKSSKELTCGTSSWTADCGAESVVATIPNDVVEWQADKHTCYVPFCRQAPALGSATCRNDTGGTCSFLGCSSSRGATQCVNGACLCDRGLCEQGGHCVKPAQLSPCCRDTGGTCRVSGCDASRGPAECVDHVFGISGRCVCPPGYCVEAGVCVKREKLERSWAFADGSKATSELTATTCSGAVEGFGAASWTVSLGLALPAASAAAVISIVIGAGVALVRQRRYVDKRSSAEENGDYVRLVGETLANEKQ
eukprot:TRINITY_DN18233_c0_g3_i1.p1 TRINITY_DN18233_c0_g3~~TRINITY_DN18233_c0_g3_i1.p1  ORF type:complete len:677 (+),score=103.83 TRINITY_DN18233_c0_g3_i1:32-2032(+)